MRRALRPRVIARALAAISICLTQIPVALAATDAQVQDARNRAVAWLVLQQSGEGNWSQAGASGVLTAASAISAMRAAGAKGYPYHAALAWLSNVETASVDSLSRQIVALIEAQRQHDTLVATLDEWKSPTVIRRVGAQAVIEPDAALWGTARAHEFNFLDTAIALRAKRKSTSNSLDVSAAAATLACHLLPHQSTVPSAPGRAWPLTFPAGGSNQGAHTNVVPSLLVTALLAVEIHEIKAQYGIADSLICGGTPRSISAAVNDAAAWILSRRGANGGFSDRGSSPPTITNVVDSAIAYAALAVISPVNAGPTLDYLIAQQNSASGHWNSEVVATALVASVLPPTPIQVDTDGDGMPDALEALLGTSPTVRDGRGFAGGQGSHGSGLVALPCGVLGAEMQSCGFSGTAVQGQSFSLQLSAVGGSADIDGLCHRARFPEA